MIRKVSFLILSIALSSAPALKAKTFKIATVSPDGLSWMKKLRDGAREIEERTDGRVKFKIYPGGVQGDDHTVLRKMRIGQLHGGAVAAGSLIRFYPDLQVYNLPLRFKSFEEVDYVRERMDDRIIEGLSDAGITSFHLAETGFAYILSKDPVRTVDDLDDIKAWVPEGDPVSADMIEAFGVSPIPLQITDVLAGLQTGLIDAVAVPPIVAIALQWHNHVNYITDLPIMYIFSTLALDKKDFESISDADQALVREVMNRVFEEVDRDNRKANIEAYQTLLDQGIEEVKPSEDELPRWEARVDKSMDYLIESGDVSQESLDLFLDYLAEARRELDDNQAATGVSD